MFNDSVLNQSLYDNSSINDDNCHFFLNSFHDDDDDNDITPPSYILPNKTEEINLKTDIINTTPTTYLNNKRERNNFKNEKALINNGELLLDSYNNNNNTKKNYFNINITNNDENKKKLKRGRKKKDAVDKGKHTKLSEDNIIRKIKTFVINSYQKFIKKIIKDSNLKLKKLDPYISENLKREFNIQLWNASLKDIYSKTNITKRCNNENGINVNKNIINKIYEDNKNNEVIKILNLTFGEVYEIFIKDISGEPISLELSKKIEGTEILDSGKFYRVNNLLTKIRYKEIKNKENEEDINKYIKDIKNLCLGLYNWFIMKKGKVIKKCMKYNLN